MTEILPSTGVLALACVLGVYFIRRFGPSERAVLTVSLFAHLLAAFAQIWITYGFYGSGDMTTYFMYGEILADLIRHDVSRFLPEVTKLFFQEDANLPVAVLGAGSATGTMSAVAGLFFLILGNSKYASCILVASSAFFGKLALYTVARKHFSSKLRPHAAACVLLIPSTVYWSSGMIKEAVAFAALGVLVRGLHLIIESGRLSVGFLTAAPAAVVIGLVKPYVLFPLAVGAGFWFYCYRAMSRRRAGFRPLYVGLSVAAAAGGVALLSVLFPRYSMDNIAAEAAMLQQVGAEVDGGSNYQIADAQRRSLLGQLGFAPVALFTALLRPVIFEARNLLMFLSSLETTLLTLLFVRILALRSWLRVWRSVVREPFLIFSGIFALLFATAVGLASTNLGTLSRYRIPLMPFFALTLLGMWYGPRSRTESPPQRKRHPSPRLDRY